MELEAVARMLDAASTGLGVVLLDGDAGIGKTTVWRAAVERARDRFRVLVSRPAESERELPFVALSDLLEAVPEEAFEGLPGPQRRALDIALLRVEAKGSPLHRRAVSQAFLGVLLALAESESVLIAVDDVQWLDPASARAVGFVLRRLERVPVAVLAAQRRGEPETLSLDLCRDVPEDRLHHLRLAPLELDALARVVRERVGGSLLRPELKWLHLVSGGNPFIAIEIAKTLVARGRGFGREQPLEIPTSLRGLVERRLARLSAPAREAALAVSALARPTVVTLEAVLGAGGRDAIRGGVDAGVLDVEGERVRLSHPLIGSALYSEVSPERRRELHRRLAQVASDLEERAPHLALAVHGPDPAVAAELDEAARRARFRGALDAAARLAEQAAQLTPPGQAGDRRRRTLEAAEYHFDAGATVRARSLLGQLTAASPPGRERADVLVRLAEVTFAEDGWASAVEPLAHALAEAGGDPRLSAHIERRLAWGYHMAGDLTVAEGHARRAASLAESIGEPALLAQTLANRALLGVLRGGGIERPTMERAIAHERQTDRLPILERPSWLLAVMLQWADDLEGARTTFERLHAESVERGDESSRPFLLHYLARVDCRAGQLASAERFALEALEITLQTGQETEQAFTLSTCALVDAQLGRVDATRSRVREGLALAARAKLKPAEFEFLATLGFLELSLGNAADADRVLGPLASAVAAAGFGEPSVFRFHPDAIEALIALGRPDDATALLESLERSTAALGGAWASATAARCRGLLLAARGDTERAARTLEAALEHRERLAQPFEHGRTLLALGATQRRRKQKRAARAALEEARGVFDALPAPLWASKARAELARLGGRPATRWELTETEQRVAELVAAGRTNREVADALFISVKTVEWNLSKIYRKLGVRSRTELASKAGASAAKAGDSPGSSTAPPP